MRKLTFLGLLLLAAAAGCKKENNIVGKVTDTEDADRNITISASQYKNMAANALVSSETTFSYSGKDVRVKVYSRDVGDSKNSPIFKYGDLINRAIAYKNANPGVDVSIKFAMYKIGTGSYVGFDPSHSSYGYVKGNDFGGDHSEKLIYSIVKAALNQVHIDFVYQFDASGDVYSYITGFLNDPCVTDATKTVGDYLRIRKVNWGTESHQQMHAKYMTVSHYAGDGSNILNTVYSTTGNVDDHGTDGIPTSKDWVQSGILINGHEELMDSYNEYFDLIFNNYSSHSSFKSAVRSAHASNSLNYDDEYFSSYFYPIPLSPQGNYTYVAETGDSSSSNGNAWDTTFNPIAKYVSRMASVSGDRYFKANVYHLKTDNFGRKLYNELYNIYNSGVPGLKHFRFVIKENSYENVFPLSNFNNIGIITEPAATHAKDVLFAFSGVTSYYSITGSTNLKLDAHCSKANASVVVKEYTTAHPVYNAFKTIYEYQY